MEFTILAIGVLGIGVFNSFLSELFLEKFFQVNKSNPALGKFYCIMASFLGIAGFASIQRSLFVLLPKLQTKHTVLLGFITFFAIFISTYKKYHGKKIPLLK